jgi:hypothetical protein
MTIAEREKGNVMGPTCKGDTVVTQCGSFTARTAKQS